MVAFPLRLLDLLWFVSLLVLLPTLAGTTQHCTSLKLQL